MNRSFELLYGICICKLSETLLSFYVGTLPFAYSGCYTVSKHAIEAFSYCLMEEVVHDGVSVHLVRPTGQKTNIINPDIQRKQWEDDFDRQSHGVKQKYGPNLIKCKLVLDQGKSIELFDWIRLIRSIEEQSNQKKNANSIGFDQLRLIFDQLRLIFDQLRLTFD